MSILDREDYVEPRCLLGMDPMGQEAQGEPVPLRRIIEKMDEICDRRDFAAAERHLDYWLAEARQNGDRRGEFSLLNERMGFMRKQERKADAYAAAEDALAMLGVVGEDSIAAGTCYVNCGTVFDNFDEPEKAVVYFEKARPIYERELDPSDARLGGLYNNMALALAGVGRFDEANALFHAALRVMEGTQYGPWEQAVTYLNMADAAAAEHGIEEAEETIRDCLERASALLDSDQRPDSGYYAFICDKCAPGFEYYGWFAYAAELRERSENYYERT